MGRSSLDEVMELLLELGVCVSCEIITRVEVFVLVDGDIFYLDIPSGWNIVRRT